MERVGSRALPSIKHGAEAFKVSYGLKLPFSARPVDARLQALFTAPGSRAGAVRQSDLDSPFASGRSAKAGAMRHRGIVNPSASCPCRRHALLGGLTDGIGNVGSGLKSKEHKMSGRSAAW